MITVSSMVQNKNGFFQLQKSQQALFDSSVKLASGKRINSSKDDPAGLAIANLITSQIRGANQSIRNANDGISLTQVTDGALQGANDVLQRMRELAVQASNGTLNESNRNTIQTEINHLTEQLGDIGENTKFNGISVFNHNQVLSIHVGFNQGINLPLSSLGANTLTGGLNVQSGGLNSGRVDVASSGINANSISINGIGLGGLAATTSGQANVKADLINQASGQTGVTASASNLIQGGHNNINQPVTAGISVTIDGNTTTLGSSANVKDFIKDFNLNVAGAEARLDSNGAVQIFNDTGKDITLSDTTVAGLGSLGLSAGTFTGSISLASANNEDITIATTDTGGIEDLKAFGFNQQQGRSSLTGGQINGQNVTSADGIQINGVNLGNIGQAGTTINANDISLAINSISGQTRVTASANTDMELTVDVSALQNNNLTINGQAIFSGFTGSTLNDVISQINAANIGDITASSNVDGQLQLTSNSGQTINIDNGASAFSQNGVAIANSVSEQGELSLIANDGGAINIKSTAAISVQTVALNKLGLSDVGGFNQASAANVVTADNASNLIDNIDNIINQIGETRSHLGATQSRLLSTINNLSATMVQSASSRSRIEDADYASTISEFIKARLALETGNIVFVKQQEAERAFINQLIGR